MTTESPRSYWQTLRRDPRMLWHFVLRAVALVRRGGVRALWTRFGRASAGTYDEWISRFGTLRAGDTLAIAAHLATLAARPRFSLIVVADASLRFDATINRVRDQLYPDWELFIAVPDGVSQASRESLNTSGRGDTRVRTVTGSSAAAAVNRALDCAEGEYAAVLASGELAAHALYMMAVAITNHPGCELLYSDEDCIDANGARHTPSFKPDWNPDLLACQPYIGPLVVYSTALVRRLGGWRDAYAGLEAWDLALRASASMGAASIRHLPHILYHRHAVVDAPPETPPPAVARRMLEEHLVGGAVAAQPDRGESASWRIVYPHSPRPLVSVITPTHNGVALLRRCVESLLHGTDYADVELFIVDNRSDDPATLDYLARLQADGRARVLRCDAPFNFSAINNRAAAVARGAVLALLNDDVEVISRDWLVEMVSHAMRPEVGAVGALLLYPDGRVQHAGIALGLGGLVGHAGRGLSPDQLPIMYRCTHNVSAVTGACLVLRAEVYRAVGGLDDALATGFNDVDLCLRLRQRGYHIVWTPHARLYHHESATRGRDTTTEKARRFRREEALMRQRWGQLLDEDPAYNPNLALIEPGFALAFPPRATKPWRPTRG